VANKRYIRHIIRVCFFRDVFGDAALVGDRRWGGSWGIDAELWARTKVSAEGEREGQNTYHESAFAWMVMERPRQSSG
jgi:hypothetical protein